MRAATLACSSPERYCTIPFAGRCSAQTSRWHFFTLCTFSPSPARVKPRRWREALYKASTLDIRRACARAARALHARGPRNARARDGPVCTRTRLGQAPRESSCAACERRCGLFWAPEPISGRASHAWRSRWLVSLHAHQGHTATGTGRVSPGAATVPRSEKNTFDAL